jgi:hypothetical protein
MSLKRDINDMSFSGLNGVPRRLVGAKLARAKTEALQSEDWSLLEP